MKLIMVLFISMAAIDAICLVAMFPGLPGKALGFCVLYASWVLVTRMHHRYTYPLRLI